MLYEIELQGPTKYGYKLLLNSDKHTYMEVCIA